MAGIRLCIRRCRTSDDVTPINEVICAVCARPMTLHNPASFRMETALLVLEIDSILERQPARNA
jgi:hypothetical protein